MPRRRWIVLSAGVAVAVLLGATAVVTYAASPDVPRGATVLGVDVGGRATEAAAQALRDGLADQAEQLAKPVEVTIGEQKTTVQPQDVGLSVDVDATVQAAADSGTGPFSAVAGLFGRKVDVEPVVTVDAERLAKALQGIADKAGSTMTMPGVTFDGTTPKPIYPKAGQGLDKQVAADAVRQGWLAGTAVTVPLVEVTPVSTAADVDQIVAELAQPAVAQPVTVTTDKGEIEIAPEDIAQSLIISADAQGKLTSKVDQKKLRTAIKPKLQQIETTPRDAKIDTGSGTPTVLASTGGILVDTDKLAKDLLPILGRTADRSVKADLKTVQPKTTSEDLTALGIRERVSSFTTYFDGGLSSGRSKNIVQAAKEVDGAIVQPGETFSLNGHTGPRGYAEGYVDAPIIMDGKLVPGVGGGVSQFTTTIFNAAYYAGLQDVEHKPHSYYFSRYPSVIESTIFYPNLDLKFKNNTPYGVLIDTSYTDSSITVSMWSTKIYDSVKTEYGPRRNIVQPKRVVLKPGPTCIATAGIEGFTQDAWRVFRKNGEEVKREKFTWRYDAEPRFVCGE